MPYFPENVFVEERVLDEPLTRRILDRLSPVSLQIIRNSREVIGEFDKSPDPVGEGKKHLLLAWQKGRFVKPCPCTPHYIGCNYFIINPGLNCPLDCSYCILQGYLSNPLITVHVNFEDLWIELDGFLEKHGRRVIRIGTGELGDSLALDHFTENSRDFVSYFREKSNVRFELKTKTDNISHLLAMEPAANVIVSWSLNTEEVAEAEEKGAPSVEERIRAALSISAHGFKVDFHFDPLIRYPGWKEEYGAVVRKLLSTIPPSEIAWISLGCLRFPPALKLLIQKRFPGTGIIYDEFITGRDGKLRYFRPLRLELYRHVVDRIRCSGGQEIPLYLCMESRETWKEVLKWKPRGAKAVELSLSPRSCQQIKPFGLE